MSDNQVNLFHSFRFKIVWYTLLSIFYTMLTEGVLFLFVRVVRIMVLPQDYFFEQINIKNSAAKMAVEGPVMQNAPVPDVPKQSMGGIFILFMVLLGIIFFIFYFILLTQKFSSYLSEIQVGISQIASGNLSSRIQIRDKDEFAIIADRLNMMADDIGILMESERKSEKIKNDLITNVAHDLRTPLTSIIGYLDLTMRKGAAEEENKKYIKIAYDKAKRLENLIEDLFSYTKFGSDEMKIKLQPINLVKLLEQMADEFYPALMEASLVFDFKTNSESAIVMADGDMLARAFSNLIGNAVKYGRDGKNIRIHIDDKGTEVSVSVINYGEVISKEDLVHIFDRFYRVESSRNTETGGTGLGLAIAKHIILMHDGVIRASSGMEGTVFEVTLQRGMQIIEKDA